MPDTNIPLAVRMRPQTLDEMVGQEHVLGRGKILERAIRSKRLASVVLSGPAGCGKTTIGFIIAKELDTDFEYLNAAFSSVSQVKKIIEDARKKLQKYKRKTTLFIDEIHRFNKLQQESLVPDTESANIVLVGATIYNPYYYLIPSLISRSIIAKFNPLSKDQIIEILKKAVCDKEKGLADYYIQLTNKAIEYIAICSNGDARSALTALEIGALTVEGSKQEQRVFDLETAKECIQKKTFYDKKDDYHYDSISAFIKSMRGSDVDSALYWLAKMLKSGEDPRFIARRMTILASEDIGNANPFALVLATSCFKAVEFVGMPEAQLILAQTVIYLAASAKSNSAYLAIENASKDLEQEATKEVPKHIKTHSKDYKYPHSFGGYVDQDYGANKQYYFPKSIGEEKKIKSFLEQLKNV
ncbi:MAG: replication-associated recombination protein A [Candidatus Omnitrophica bacterium]|nr:replication-associated recombination protein A [Candidatus Omnitrophota bacterium]